MPRGRKRKPEAQEHLTLHRLHFDLFEMELVVAIGTRQDFDDWSERVYGMRLSDGLSDSATGGQFQIRSSDNEDISVVWLPGWDGGAGCTGTLAHELVHAAVEMLKTRSIPVVAEGNSELLAYCVGGMVSCVLEEIKEAKDGKNNNRGGAEAPCGSC